MSNHHNHPLGFIASFAARRLRDQARMDSKLIGWSLAVGPQTTNYRSLSDFTGMLEGLSDSGLIRRRIYQSRG